MAAVRWMHKGRPNAGRRATARWVLGLLLMLLVALVAVRALVSADPSRRSFRSYAAVRPPARLASQNTSLEGSGGLGRQLISADIASANTTRGVPPVSDDDPFFSRPLQWPSDVYLPLTAAARAGFQAHDKKLRKRMAKAAQLHRIWGLQAAVVPMLLHHGGGGSGNNAAAGGALAAPTLRYDFSFLEATVAGAAPHDVRRRVCHDVVSGTHDGTALACGCLRVAPECQFFLHVGNASMAFVKCCTEHYKMRTTLRDLMLALDGSDTPPSTSGGGGGSQQGHALHQMPQLFLDSGTLLSAVRDGGATLLPWETDIDLGVVGSDPQIDQFWQRCLGAPPQSPLNGSGCTRPTSLLRQPPHHHVERCRIDPATLRCNDAHYVYFASDGATARHDTSRVEIWPFHHNQQAQMLEHPTRPWLSVAVRMVLPLRPCTFWGLQLHCPQDGYGYLDHEYEGRDGWRRPRTIHWGERNVQSWGGSTRNRSPNKTT